MAISREQLLREYSLEQLRELSFFGGLADTAIIALHDHKGAVVEEDACLLKISGSEFFKLYEAAGDDFAMLMMNLARGMARTIDSLTRLIAVLQES
jgi:hypothetical protein